MLLLLLLVFGWGCCVVAAIIRVYVALTPQRVYNNQRFTIEKPIRTLTRVYSIRHREYTGCEHARSVHIETNVRMLGESCAHKHTLKRIVLYTAAARYYTLEAHACA